MLSLFLAIVVGVKWNLIVDFFVCFLHFPVTKDVTIISTFYVLIVCSYFFFSEVSLQLFCLVSYSDVHIIILICTSSLYSLVTSIISHIYLANVFSSSVVYLVFSYCCLDERLKFFSFKFQFKQPN